MVDDATTPFDMGPLTPTPPSSEINSTDCQVSPEVNPTVEDIFAAESSNDTNASDRQEKSKKDEVTDGIKNEIQATKNVMIKSQPKAPSSRGTGSLDLIPEEEPCTLMKPNEDEFVDPSELTFHKVIGCGGQAKVFLATWTRSFGFSSSSVTVAVKKMKPSVTNIDRESLALRVYHPNLVQCFGASMHELPYLIVMEYCRGGSLYDHIYHKSSFSMTWDQRMKIACDVADGMAYLHSHTPKITHRDLKSTNILLVARIKDEAEEPHVKITDFGLARAQGHRGTWGAMTQCVGTWRWMAPEVFSSTRYDEKADVFSFAMVMYELVTLRIPYSENWPDTKTMLTPRIGLHVVQGLRPILDSALPGCPPQILDMTKRSWQAEPESRPSFEEIAEELHNQLKLMQVYKMVKGPSIGGGGFFSGGGAGGGPQSGAGEGGGGRLGGGYPQ